MLPSRLGAPKARPNFSQIPSNPAPQSEVTNPPAPRSPYDRSRPTPAQPDYEDTNIANGAGPDDITITISSILSSDPLRSVDALKKIQKILVLKPEEGPSSTQYQDLAEHTEGLIETITLQMAHVFDRPEDLVVE